VLVYLYSVAGLGLQYLNLYRSVWWLPHRYSWPGGFSLLSSRLSSLVAGVAFGNQFVTTDPEMIFLYFGFFLGVGWYIK
jgi:hypothetical protein